MRKGRGLAHELALTAYRRADEAGDVAATGKALSAAGEVLRSSLKLRQVLVHPGAPEARRVELLNRLAPLTPVARALVVALMARRMLGSLAAIARAYLLLAEAKAATVTARVETAAPLAKAEAAKLRSDLARALGRPVTLAVVRAPKLIGGLRIQAGELTVDGSVSGAFDRLASSLGTS